MSDNVFTEAAGLFVEIEAAASPEAAAAPCTAVWQRSQSLGAPFKLFAPFLVQPSFPPAVLDRIVATLRQDVDAAKPNPATAAPLRGAENTPAHMLMFSLSTYLIAVAGGRTASDNNDDIFAAAKAIARAPLALQTAIEAGAWLSSPPPPASSASAAEKKKQQGGWTAMTVYQRTVMGALLALKMFDKNHLVGAELDEHARMQLRGRAMIARFPWDREHHQYDARKKDETDMEIHHGLKMHTTRVKELLEACLRSTADARTRTFAFVSHVFELNGDYRKSRHNDEVLWDYFSLFALTHAFIQLATPILSQKNFFPHDLSSDYLFDASEHALCRFESAPGDAETIVSGDDAPARPVVSKAEAYSPRYHMFFLALRGVELAVLSCAEHVRHAAREINYYASQEEHRAALPYVAARFGSGIALLSYQEGASQMLRFLDGVAEWLMAVVRVDAATGEIPSSGGSSSSASGTSGTSGDSAVGDDRAPAQWAHLPLSIIDALFRVTNHLVVEADRITHRPPLDRAAFYEFSNICGVCLLLMGNHTLLPKAYTHLNYPRFFGHMLRLHERELRNHPWFVSHSLRGCIECYIIVETQEYERQSARYYLGDMMKLLLSDSQVVGAVKARYEAKAGHRTLEILTKCMSSEASSALEECIGALDDMHKKEAAANNTIPRDDDEYEEKKERLRNGNALARTALSIFGLLLDRFKNAMMQHLVVQQVGAMLMTFLIKLAGPGSAELKSLSMELAEFRPREITSLIVEVFLRFHDIPDFCRYCVESTGDVPAFFDACSRIRRLGIIPAHMMVGLTNMERSMRDAMDSAKLEDEVYDDPPDWACCQIYSTILKDPVFLPGDGKQEDLVCTDRQTIDHQLSTNPMNPYTRQPLTMDEVEAFNATPEMKAKVADLLKKIDEWKAEKRRASVQKQAEAAAAKDE